MCKEKVSHRSGHLALRVGCGVAAALISIAQGALAINTALLIPCPSKCLNPGGACCPNNMPHWAGMQGWLVAGPHTLAQDPCSGLDPACWVHDLTLAMGLHAGFDLRRLYCQYTGLELLYSLSTAMVRLGLAPLLGPSIVAASWGWCAIPRHRTWLPGLACSPQLLKLPAPACNPWLPSPHPRAGPPAFRSESPRDPRTQVLNHTSK